MHLTRREPRARDRRVHPTGERRARAIPARSPTRLTRALVYPEAPRACTGPGHHPSAATHPFNRLQFSSYTNCNLGGRPVPTALDGWLQLCLYTSSNSARQPIASSVVHKLQLIPSTDCNFRRTQIATLVVGQLHFGWVG